MTTFHPHPDDHGRAVRIHAPSTPSPASTWGDPTAIAIAVPGGHVPAGLNGVPFAPWCPSRDADAWWEAEAARTAVPEPAFNCPAGMKPAAGAVVLEPDGRAWVVAPTNRFGGHEFTLPKGRVDGSRSLAATALVEVFEEVGLQVELQAWLCDVPRSITYTRIYIGWRIGGSPTTFGWESQATVLAPLAALRELLTHPSDHLVLGAFEKLKPSFSNNGTNPYC